MAGPAPKSKATEITDRLNSLVGKLRDGGGFDEMSWQRIRRDLEALEKAPDYCKVALQLQAVLWEMRHEREKVKSFLNQAAGRYGKDLNWYLTRANMAPTFGDTSLITDMLEHGYPAGSRAGLSKVVSMCSHAGMFASATKALDDLTRLDERAGQEMEADLSFVRHASNYLAVNGIPELDVANRVVTASRVVVDHQFILTRYVVRSDEDGLLFEFVLDGDIERLVEVNLAIADALAVEFEDTLFEHLSIGVTPKEEAA